MSNCVLGFPNYSDVGVLHSPALSGPASALPLASMQTRFLDEPWRSTDATVASTQFAADLMTARAVRVLALWKHNLSSAGKARARAYTVLPVANKLDFADSTNIITPTRVAASYNANGVILDKMGDDNVSGVDGSKWVAGWTGDGQKVVEFEIGKDTSTSSVIRVRDVTAGANRLLAAVTWSGTVAVVTMTTGTQLSSTLIADGKYRVALATTSVTAANNNEIEFYPATDAALAIGSTGQVFAGNFSWFNAATDQLLYDSLFSAAYPAGLTAEDVEDMNLGWVHVPTAEQTARYWFFNIWDTANAAGFVQVARLVIAKGWQPTVNMEYPASIEIQTDSKRERAWGGATIHDRRARYRVQRVSLNDEPEAEALSNGLKIQRIAGTDRQVFWVFDATDTAMHERAMLCTLSRLGALEMPFIGRYSTGWEFTEEL